MITGEELYNRHGQFTETLDELLSKLKQVRFLMKIGIGRLSTHGICYWIYESICDSTKGHKVKFDIWQSWEHYSGCKQFPVPASKERSWRKQFNNEDFSPMREATNAYYEASFKWLGEYGKLRIELIDYMIESLDAYKAHVDQIKNQHREFIHE